MWFDARETINHKSRICQIFWWSLGIACLAVPAASILWKAGTAWMVSVITAVLLAISWITAIASAGGMFFGIRFPFIPWHISLQR